MLKRPAVTLGAAMKDFDAWMTAYQVRWRENHGIAPGENGRQNGKAYPWILPKRLWHLGLWPGIQSGRSGSVEEYLRDNDVQEHKGVHNLKSSWVQCANVYYPFRATTGGRELLAGFLRTNVLPEVQTVDDVQLEYAEDGDLHPSALLGEVGGSRGTGQTSPDVAFLVNGKSGLILAENKLLEKCFYRCSARRRNSTDDRPGNPDPTRCLNPARVVDNPESQCHQAVWGRKYWERLLPVTNREVVAALRCCPAANGGYQLFRQQALAAGIAASGKYDVVASCVAYDARNDTLVGCLRRSGIDNFTIGWGRLFSGKAKFATWTHQQWVAWVRANDHEGAWREWLAYVEARYGYGEATA